MYDIKDDSYKLMKAQEAFEAGIFYVSLKEIQNDLIVKKHDEALNKVNHAIAELRNVFRERIFLNK